MSEEYIYRVYCNTETASNGGEPVYVTTDWITGQPTECPNDPGHSIDLNKTGVLRFRDIIESKNDSNFSTSNTQYTFLDSINKTPEYGRWYISFSGSISIVSPTDSNVTRLALFKNSTEIDSTHRLMTNGRYSIHTQAVVDCDGTDVIKVGLKTDNSETVVGICSKSLVVIPA